MVDHIKLDNIGAYVAGGPLDTKSKPLVEEQAKPKEDVAVSTSLGDLVKLINTIPEPQNASALSDIKEKIQHNDYRIDFDKLSDQLMGNGILSTNG